MSFKNIFGIIAIICLTSLIGFGFYQKISEDKKAAGPKNPAILEVVIPENIDSKIFMRGHSRLRACERSIWHTSLEDNLQPFPFYVTCEKVIISPNIPRPVYLIVNIPFTDDYIFDVYKSINKCRRKRNYFNGELEEIPAYVRCREIPLDRSKSHEELENQISELRGLVNLQNQEK